MAFTAEQQGYLNTLEDVAKLIQKTQVNLKKCPKSRLTDGYIKARLKCIDDYWSSFKQAHESLARCTPRDKRGEIPYFLNEDYFVIEDLYLCLQADLSDMLKEMQRVAAAAETSHLSGASSQEHCSLVKLPRIQLPSFSGRYEEWPTYQDMFTSLVHNNSTISDVQKLHYLKSSVTGEAEMLLRPIQITDSNYLQAWNLLKERYGNKRVIVFSVLKRLFNQKKITVQTSSSVKNILDTTTECINNLKNLQINTDSWDPVIIFLVVQKLDQESHKEWETHAYKEKPAEMPSWDDLRKFLESKFRTLEMIQPVPNKDRAIKERAYHAVSITKDKSCALCNEWHTLCHCENFIKMNLTQRNNYVKENQLCYNCLRPGHSVYKCRIPVNCHICRRRHHTLLHEPNSINQSDSIPAHYTNVQENEELQTTNQPDELTLSSHLVTNRSTTLLATALLPVKDARGHITVLRALIDQGSQANFISERAAQMLHLERTSIKGSITGVGSTQTSVKHMVHLELLSNFDDQFKLSVTAYVMATQLTSRLPTETIINSTSPWSHLEGLSLADPTYGQPGKIDMLLGVEVYAYILKSEIIKGPPGSPCAQNTSLGWILFGNVQTNSSSETMLVLHHCVNIDDMLQSFWELDTCKKNKLTAEEERCEQIYNETHRRNEEGKYIVKLPFKTENPKILKGDTKQAAMRRLLQLEKRFDRDNHLKTEYSKVMEEYLALNHMEEVPISEVNNPSVYLPHHAVIKESSETTKIRVVFDASSLNSNNISLNSELLVGPPLQEDIRSLVMRWRLRRVGYVADIEKMFRMILIAKEDADFQRVLWRREKSGPIKDYRLLRVTFGTAAATYLAVKTMQQVAEDEASNTAAATMAAATIKEDFFIDDLMSGQDSSSEAIEVAKEVANILKRGGFTLQKWSSNSKEFMEHFATAKGSSLVKLDITVNETIRTLGLCWDLRHDTLRYYQNLPCTPAVITKRTILSEIQTLFDPLGWLTPALVLAKQIIQKLWLQGTSWDDPVNSEIREEWLTVKRSLNLVKDIQLDRWLHTEKSNMDEVSIHGFCDASTKAYGAVAYLRTRTAGGEFITGIVAAKSRIAPVKPVSLPRLELCGAVLLSQLLRQISHATRVPASQIYAWTDSTIVLAWLQGDPTRWQTFVRNRVVTILENIGNKWYHVRSEDNPADIASRGMLLPELKKCRLWWHGPVWLKGEEIDINQPNTMTTNLEIKREFMTNLKINENEASRKNIIEFENYNSLDELLRILTYCKKFLNYKKWINRQGEHTITYLTAEELNSSLETCIRLAQSEDFSTEIIELQEKRPISSKSKIINLNPYLDSKNLLRVGGRLTQAHLEENNKHPIILGHQNKLVPLIIADAHKKTLHGGIQLMMSYLRTRFWIIRMKSLVTTHLHRCIICAKLKARSKSQLMGDLPEVRVTPARPFLHSGVDYAGPLQILSSRGRGAKIQKGYICIFICMATKAIHLELVSDMTTATFLSAFRRFVSRRGRCSQIWSDQGTNFVGANRELLEHWRAAELDIPKDFASLLAEEGTRWHFNPPYSPNFSGLWEAGVKSIKHHLKRVLHTNLTFEEFSTVLCQIEACLNSRPLCPIDSGDTENLDILTPGHFLIGEAPIAIPEPDLTHINPNRLSRWQHTQQLVQHMWKRWQSEYLSRLQQRPKWLRKREEFRVGEVVLIKDCNLPPGKWALGRITEKHPGRDKVCRVYSVKCCGKIIKRSISNLCKLPIND